MPALPEQHVFPAQHGTRVAVHDLFGCIPVRARLRPASDRAAWSRDWDELVRSIAALLLAWPRGVVVVIRAENATGHGRLPVATIRAAASPPAAQDADVSRSARLLLQAGLCDAAGAASWVRVGSSVPGITVSGCVCLTPSASRRTQFIRIGIEPLSERHHADVLYDEINKLFSDSRFGTDAASAPRPRPRSMRKAVDRWPMFSIGIDFDDPSVAEVDDILDDRRQHLEVILALVRTMVVQFLKEHGLYGQPSMLYGSSDSAKSGSESSDCNRSMIEPPSIKRRKTCSIQKRNQSCRARARGLPSRNSNLQQSPFMTWSRVKSMRTEPETNNRSKATVDMQCSDQGQSDDASVPGTERESSLRGILLSPKTTSRFFGGSGLAASDGETCMSEWNGSSVTRGDVRISRESLAAAKVIGQVDQKFILVKIPTSDDEGSGSTDHKGKGHVLALVDQHAADERCRIEALLTDYFVHKPSDAGVLEARTASLEKPLQFELDAHERPLLERLQAHFHFWGVVYTLAATDTHDAVTLRVHKLPESVFERCRHDSRLVVQLIRKEIWARHESGCPLRPSQEDPDKALETERSWVSRFHGCPQGIMDLLNTRACHSTFHQPYLLMLIRAGNN